MNVLGIDAAWTDRQPSGVALISQDEHGWRCLAVAPSYAQFIAASQGCAVDWEATPCGSRADAAALIAAASTLAGAPPDLITVDMPLAMSAISGRRAADDAISREFGGRGCGTHSPSAARPGKISDDLREALSTLGYPLATAAGLVGTTHRTLEVYPHPALLLLTKADYRVPYKVSKVRKYRRSGQTVEDAWRSLRTEWQGVVQALGGQIQGLPDALNVAAHDDAARATRLKRFEDGLDALICAWVGARYLEGRATAYGDADAAVWCPT